MLFHLFDTNIVSKLWYILRHKYKCGKLYIRLSSNKIIQKNTHLNVGVYFQPDLVKSYGYPFEEHFIETEDGYKLALHRIPGVQRKNQGNKKAPIVLLAHCLMSSSAVFTYGPTNNSLAYVLANKGGS